MANKYLFSRLHIWGHCKMTRLSRLSVSQKLASWKGSAEDAKAGKYKIRVNQCNPRLNIIEFSVLSVAKNLCNPWLLFRAYKAPVYCQLFSYLYNCRESFTNQTFYAKRTQFRERPNERK